MKKYSLFILLLMLLIAAMPAAAKGCHVSGKIDDVIDNMNNIAELLSYSGFATRLPIDTNNCDFVIQDNSTGLYICQVNASTVLYLSTDKYLNVDIIQIHGNTKTNAPSESTYDWAFVAAIAACLDLKTDEIQSMFLESFKSGYYMDKNILMVCSMHPDVKNLWVFSVSNR